MAPELLTEIQHVKRECSAMPSRGSALFSLVGDLSESLAMKITLAAFNADEPGGEWF